MWILALVGFLQLSGYLQDWTVQLLLELLRLQPFEAETSCFAGWVPKTGRIA